MSKLFIVIKETYLRQIKSASFWLMIAAPFLFIGLSAGIGWVTSQVAQSSDSSRTIALVSQDEMLKHQLSTVEMEGFTTEYSDENAAKKALEEETILGYINVTLIGGQIESTYYGSEAIDIERESYVTTVLQTYQSQINISEAGLSEEQQGTIARQMSFKQEVSPSKETKRLGQYISFYALVMLMYILLLVYTSLTGQEIGVEKGTKIMEVIFSSIPAHLYFWGRILGIFATIVTHIGIYIVGGILGYQTLSRLEATKELIENNQSLIDTIIGGFSLSTILFIILGIFIYVVLSALCGSIVTRVEDINKALQPVMYLLMIAFFGSFILGQTEGNILLKIGSYIPFLSSFFMPIRYINDNALAFEVWVSLVILLVSTLGLIFYVSKSYAGLVLQTDDIGLWKSFKKGISSR